MPTTPSGGVKARPYNPKVKRGKKGYRIGGQGHRIGGQGHRLGKGGHRVDQFGGRITKAPSAPPAPKNPWDNFGSIAPGTNPEVTLPQKKGYYAPAPAKPGSPTVSYDANGNPIISGSAYNPAAGDDPRNVDPNYWKNFFLIQKDANQQYAATLAEQKAANIGYDTYVDDTKKAAARARTSFARSLIGTGLLRSGYHNQARNEANTARDVELIRAAAEKQGEDNARTDKLGNILTDFSVGEYGLYSNAVDEAVQRQMDAAAEGEGIYGGGKKKKKGENTSGGGNNGGGGNGRGGGNNNGSGGVAPPSKSLQDYNKIIGNLKKKYAKASTPKAKKRIHAKIKQVRKRKNSKYGR